MKLSGSRYHLAQLCAYPFRPDAPDVAETSSAAAALGTAVHSYVEEVVKDGQAANPRFYTDDALKIGKQAVHYIGNVGIPAAVELAIAYDPIADSARRIETREHRDYGTVLPTEIPTTLDLVWVEDDAIVVRDLKTGKREHAHREQLVIQALAASRLFRKKPARVGFVFARKTKTEPDELEELDELTLDAEAWRAAAVVMSIPNAQPQPGRHCWHCPLRDVCKASHARPEARNRYIPPEPPADTKE